MANAWNERWWRLVHAEKFTDEKRKRVAKKASRKRKPKR
jgi:hypothetical protein